MTFRDLFRTVCGPVFIVLMLWAAVPCVWADEYVDPDVRYVHDPSLIRQGAYTYVFCTGDRIGMRRSADLYNWESLGSVLGAIPQWVQDKIPGITNLWAPGPVFHNGRYYLCYAGSQWGTSTSTIGLLSNATLNPSDPGYGWVDEGEIISSANKSVPYNTIDGEFVYDADGGLWLVFGSYWNGIYVTALDLQTVKPYADPPSVTHLATRPGVQYDPIEAPYIVYRNGYYYLFVNYDICCQGVDSTYKIMVGRSSRITGPYVDKAGVAMTAGGGTLFVDTNGRWIGPGHLSVVSRDGQDYMGFHTYDGLAGGVATLRVHTLYWSADGWPVMGTSVSQPVANGPIAWWTFEDGSPGTQMAVTNAGATPTVVGSVDRTGNGNDLMAWTTANAPSFSQVGQTPYGSGLSAVFANGDRDAYTGGANVSGVDLRMIAPVQWTIEASVLFHSLDGWQTFIGRDGSQVAASDGNLSPLYFQKTWDHKFRIQFVTADGQIYSAAADRAVEANRWYHVVARSTGSQLELYVDRLDGQGFLLEAGTPMSGDTALAKRSDTSAWTVGRGMWSGNVADFVDGKIDDVRISTTALSPTAFLQHQDVLLVLTETDGATEINEEGPTSDTYYIRFNPQTAGPPPTGPVTVTLVPDGQVTVQPQQLVFTSQNYRVDQMVTVTAVDDEAQETNPHEGRVSHQVSSVDVRYNAIPTPDLVATITENDCGAWGYLPWDMNFDCRVNLDDFAMLAAAWIGEAAPVRDLSIQWLGTTQPYVPGAVVGPVQDTANILGLQTDTVLNAVDEKVYGHFLEHIYHSVNGGLWGELVWNRSLETLPAGGAWSVDGDTLVQESLGTNVRLLFGDVAWTDYELLFDAQKTGGNEGFLVLVRADGDRFYWANLGGWGNTRHQFEKGVVGGTWGSVGSSTSGSITTGQWYAIRIRCSGNRIRAYIDGTKVLDYTDPSAYLSGRMGLGTWATQARFRNIRVVDAADPSTILYSGLPAIPPMPPAAFWDNFGSGQVTRSSQALNDTVSVQIAGTGAGETGIQQTPFAATVQSYTGSLWAKGSGTLTVRLLDGAQVLAQQSLGPVGADWATYPFVLSPAAAADNATLQIALSGSGPAWVDQVSLMGQDALNVGGYRPDLLAAVEGLAPSIIRWPGGCYASAYFWKDGIGPQHQRSQYPISLWDDQDTNSYGTDEYLRMCEAIGAEPLIVVNIGLLNGTCGVPIPYKLTDEQYLRDVEDWMEYCNGSVNTTWGALRAANGHPEPYHVTYWEIDNEVWSTGYGGGITNYIAKVRQFAPVMRGKAAELGTPIKLIACGSGSYDQGWNRALIDACGTLFDYISTHHYEGPNNFRDGPLQYEGFITELGAYIAASANPQMKIYMSEWNAQSIDWRTGLYAGGLLNAFERTGAVFEIGGPALFLRHTSATGWDNAFINFDHTGWFAAPNYVVMKLWREHYAPLRIAIDGQVDGLNVVATRSVSGDRVVFKAVNPTEQEIPLKLVLEGDFDAASAVYQRVAPGALSARNTLAAPEAVRVENGPVSLSGRTVRFSLPPLSAGVVRIQARP